MEETAVMNRKFRTAFRVPDAHTLKCVTWTGSLTGANQSWEHHELDDSGALIARYLGSFSEGSDTGLDSRYRKYDPTGRLIEEGVLPPI
jgi:hypothetical protein